MALTIAEFQTISDAEDFFRFFGLEFDQAFVNVNRLHILKKFSAFIAQINQAHPDLDEAGKLELYRQALQQSYDVFKSSTPVEQKLFKVFQQKPGNVVFLSEIGVS